MLALAELGLEHNYILASATMGPEHSVAKGGKPFGVVKTQEYYSMNPTRTIPSPRRQWLYFVGVKCDCSVPRDEVQFMVILWG